MTIGSSTTRASFACNGVSTIFPVPIQAYNAADFLVILTAPASAGGASSVLTLGTDYSMLPSGTLSPSQWTMTTTQVQPTGYTLQVILNPVQTQQSQYVQGQGFPSATIQQNLDRLTQMVLRLQDEVNRCVRAPDGDVSPVMLLPQASSRALQYAAYDANGNALAVPALPGSQMTQAVFDALALTSTPFLNAYDPVVLGSAGPALTPGQAFKNLGGINMGSETTLTGALTMNAANLGASYLLADSGSPAPYTITLPAGAPVGSIIQFRVSTLATQLYTLFGNDVGIDGDANRVLWRNETCLLFREANNWAKIGGRTIPFRGCLQSGASQAIAAGTTFVACSLTQENGDTYALNLCLDAVNSRWKCPRHSSFAFAANLVLAATQTVSAATVSAALTRNSASAITTVPCTLVELPYPVGQAVQELATAGVFAMNAGDYLNLIGRIYNGTSTSPVFDYSGGVYVPSLSYAELPLW